MRLRSGVALQAVVELQRPRQDALDRLRRIERRVGHLEHDLDAAQLLAACAAASVGGSGVPSNTHRARARRQQPGDDARQRRLARARFADDADRLPRWSSRSMSSRMRHGRHAVRRRAARSRRRSPRTSQQRVGACARGAGARVVRLRRGEQALRVVVLRRREESARCVPISRMRAVAQHEDVVGHLRHHREVVAARRPPSRRRSRTTRREGAQHLDLRRHVERGRRLVEDHQRRDR